MRKVASRLKWEADLNIGKYAWSTKKVSRLYTMCICSCIKIATLWSSVGRSGNVDFPDGEKMHYRLIVLLVLYRQDGAYPTPHSATSAAATMY